MKRQLTHKRFKNRLAFMFVALMGAFMLSNAYGQTITIDSEPAGPLYVGDTIEVEYTATGFDANAEFYLVFGGDTILDSNTEVGPNALLTGVVPEDYSGSEPLEIYGVVGDPNGPEEIVPLWGELNIAGTNWNYQYEEENYYPEFDEPGIRYMELPAYDLTGDSALINFGYEYNDFFGNPDTMNIVLEYSVDGGSSYTAIDTLDYVNWFSSYSETMGLPAAAQTTSTILRFRQMDSNFENDRFTFEFQLGSLSIQVGIFPVFEGSVTLNGGANYAINLPYTNVTSVSSPAAEPYFTNLYSGDSIYLEADIVGFTADTKYEVVFNRSGNIDDPVYQLASSEAMEEIALDQFMFKGELPANMPMNQTYYFWVAPYKGATYMHGTSLAHSFDMGGGAGSNTILGEEYIDWTNGVYFTAENVRSMTTNALMISDEGTITFDLARAEDKFSPANTELVVEYSTDEGATFTEMGTIDLNSLDYYNNGFTLVEMAIPAGAVSDATHFRLRQNEINAENLDRFYLRSYSIMLNATRLAQGLAADYEGNDGSRYVNDPQIDFLPMDISSVLYPGSSITTEFEIVVGNFPANTDIEARITDVDLPIILGSAAASATGSISGTIPTLQGNYYNVQLFAKAPNGEVSSNTREIEIEEVSLEILTYIGNPDREDNGDQYFFIGDELIVDYNIVGQAMHGVDLRIQDIYGDYHTIANDNPTSEQVTGVIPSDIELGSSPFFRLYLADTLYDDYSNMYLYDINIYKGFPERAEDSMILATEGIVDEDNWPAYGNRESFASGSRRMVETEGFELTYNGQLRMRLRFPANYYGWENRVNTVAPIEIQYSTDMGSNWTTFDEVDPRDYGTWLPSYSQTYYLPNEAISDHTMFRFIQNEDNSLSFGENIWVLEYIEVLSASTYNVASGTEQIDIMQSYLSLGTLDKTTFGPGEDIEIPYNTVGNFGSNVGFAAILDYNGMEQFVVDTSSEQGLVKMNTTLPVNLVESSNYDIEVVPYDKSDNDMPVLGYMEDFDDDDTDYVTLEGGAQHSWGYNFNEAGRRSLLTKALPQLEGDSTYFDFYIWFAQDVFPSEGVVIEVTYDGGGTFAVLDTVWDTDTYTLALATSDMTDQTHLKWTQNVNFGAGQKEWQLQNMLYKSADNNLLTDGTDYISDNQPVAVTIDYPSMPFDFDITGQEDVLYSGGSFDFDFDFIEGVSQLPAGTQYDFYLADGAVIIDTNGDSVMLGSLTGTGSTTFNIPASIRKDNYDIWVVAHIPVPGEDEPFIYYDEVYVADLDVYNPVLKTTTVTEEAFRGDEITVDWELQSGTIDSSMYYFHLLIDGEVVQTQKGAPDEFVQQMPIAMSAGDKDIEVFVTTDSLYSDGYGLMVDVQNESEWNELFNAYISNYNYLRLNNSATANSITSAAFDVSQGGKVTFNFRYDDNTSEDFLESNKAYFEYSMDGGATYTVVDEFPNEDYELGDWYQMQTYYFGKGELSDSTKFRFRRESGDFNYVYIEDFYLEHWSNEAPFDFVEDQVTLLEQNIMLGDLPQYVCPGTDVTIDFDIQGLFGEDVIHYLQYKVNGNGWYSFPDFEITDVTSGSGSFTVSIPESYSGGEYRFRLRAYDPTDNDYMYTVYSMATTNDLYLVPMIDFNGTSLSSDRNLCAEKVVSYTIYNAQPYFMYQARIVSTGELYGDPIINESEFSNNLVVKTDSIKSTTELEIVVTAMMPDMNTTCATGVLDDRIAFNLIPDRKLFMDDNNSGNWTAATAMEICKGNPLNFKLETGYYDKDGNYQSGGITSITWYRDDMTTAISSNSELNRFNQSGSYFAEVIVDGCNYITNAVQVDVLKVPEQPTFTASGELTFCEGTTVELTADMEYPYYRWYGGYYGNDQMSGSSQTIEAVSDGSYRLQVSNYPFEMGCASPMSEPVQVNVIEEPNTYIYRSSGGTWIDDNRFASCGDEVYLRVNSYPQTFSWTLNGEPFSSSSNVNTLKATQTGWYNVRSVGQQNGVTCTFDTPDSIFIQISDEVPTPSITHTGDDVFCAGEGSAEITAPAGYAGYRWERNGSSITSQDVIVENSLLVEETGDYTVSVIDEFGCESDESEDTEITVIPLPYRYSSVNAPNDEICGPTVAEIRVTNLYGNNRVLMYQLVDMNTGEISGDPSSKVNTDGSSDYVTLFSDTIYGDTEFGVMVYDQNASGCDVMLENTDVVYVNAAEVTVDGNTLSASTGGSSYQWYRDGVEVPGNRGSSRSIEVYDDATYTVVVEFDMACTMTSEGVAIPGSDVPLPSFYSNVDVVDNTLCGASSAEVRISNLSQYNRELTYQLINMGTGESSGSPVTFTATSSTDFVLLESAEVSEETEFGVMVYDPNISGNETMLEETVIVDANIAEIAIVGNQLIATPGADSYQWYRNGEPIMGDRGKSSMIEVFDDASYTVTIVFGFDCILTSTDAAEVKNITGISNVLAEDNVSLYPNPTKDKVNVEFFNNYAGDITVEVTNLAGQVVHNEMISKNNQFMNMTIDMDEFQQGVYYINFITDDHSLVKSIVKQ